MLKPSDLKVTGKYRSLREHEELVKKNLKALRNKLLAQICDEILDTKSGESLNIKGLSSVEINEIKNYFAEVAGPILLMKSSLISGLNKTSKVFYSTSDTERLYDFKLMVGNKETLISNKQLTGGTNTLKPGDVIRLVDDDPELTKKWKKTKYYNVFKTLDDNNVVSGPIRAISEYYPTKHKISKKDYKSVIDKLDKNEVKISPKEVPAGLMKMIESDPIAKDHYKKNAGATGTMINFLFEKSLVEESKKDAEYHNLFVDVTSGNVSFLKFNLSNNGKIEYELSDPKKSSKKAVLRSKQGVERRSSSSGRLKLDKLGFQP